MDLFFFLISVALILINLSSGILFLSATKFFGDPLEGLKGEEEWGSFIHAIAGVFFLLMTLAVVLYLPALSEKKVLDEDDYRYSRQLESTIYSTEFDTLKIDDVYWSMIADNTDEYCVYRVETYNILGVPVDTVMTLTTPPCRDKDLYEF